MNKIVGKIKQYPFSWILILIIWILSFCSPPHTPLDNVEFIDKWAHIVMYLSLSIVIWYEYIKSHKKIEKAKLFFFAWLFPILMSGLIEILQEYCTKGLRSGDLLDFAANSLGVTLGGIIYILLLMCRAK